MLQPADEIVDLDVSPELEDFFLLCALQVGNPSSSGRWGEFYALCMEFLKTPRYSDLNNKFLLKYMAWYSRNDPQHKHLQAD